MYVCDACNIDSRMYCLEGAVGLFSPSNTFATTKLQERELGADVNESLVYQLSHRLMKDSTPPETEGSMRFETNYN